MTRLSFLTGCALGLITLSASSYANNVVVDKNSNKNQQPTVMPTANGATQINIQEASKNGVSHNKFTQFDVSEKGVILNNSSQNSKTELAGYIKGNDFLIKSGSAKVILNEVNSKNASQLAGYIEVAGQKAQVVIANAAGITCNGCGFINADRATLTTGRPIIENGELKGYLVDQGNIAITGKGMDSSRQDFTDLISRTTTINANLWANNVSVITGKNSVSIDLDIIDKQSDLEQEKPKLAIDVAALGGMYAGKIQLVGTELGVGVHNAGNLGASAGSITITADGKIVNTGAIQAKQDIALSSKQEIDNKQQIYSKQNINLKSDKSITNDGSVVAQNNVNIATKNITSTKNSTIAAGIDEKGKLTQNGGVTVNAGNVILQGKNLSNQNITVTSDKNVSLTGSNTVAKSLSIAGENIDISSSYLSVDEDIGLTASNIINSQNLQAKTNANFIAKAGSINNQQAKISAKKDIKLIASDIKNTQSQLASSQNLELLATNSLDNQKVELYAQGAIELSGQTIINNHAQLTAEGALTIQANTLLNKQSELEAKGGISLDSVMMDNEAAKILTEGALVINADKLNNQHGTLSAKSNMSLSANSMVNNDHAKLITENQLLIKSDTITNTKANIQAKGRISLAGMQIDNTSSTLISEQSILINASKINNQQSKLSALGNITMIGAVLNNQSSQLVSGKAISIQSTQVNNNKAIIKSNGKIEMSASEINNSEAEVITNDKIAIKSDTLDNQSAMLNAVNDISLQSKKISNQQAQMISTGNIDINAADANNQRADIRAKGAITISADDINNEFAALLTNASLRLTGKNIHNDQAELNANDDILLTSELLSANEAVLTTNNNLVVNTNRLNAENLTLKAKGDVRLKASSAIDAKKSLTANINTQLVNDHAKWISEGDIAVKAQTIDNQNASISTSKNISIDASLLDNSHTEILSNGNVALKAIDLINHSSKINALGNIQLEASRLDNNSAQIISQQSIIAKSVEIDNHNAAMQSQQSLLMTASDQMNNEGAMLISGDELQLKADLINNNQAKIKSKNNIQILAENIENKKIVLLTDGSITLKANDKINNEFADIRAGQEIVLNAELIDNQNSLIVTDSHLSIDTNTLNAQSSTVKANNDIDIIAHSIDSASSTWVAQQNITVNSHKLNNASSIFKAGNAIDINTNEMNNNAATLIAGGALHLVSDQFSNEQATLVGDDDIQITATQFNNQQSKVVSANNILINAQQMSNANSELQAKGDLILDAKVIDNQSAKLISDKKIQLKADDQINNQHAVFSAQDDVIAQSIKIKNNDAKWQSGADIKINSQVLDNQGSYINAKNSINIDATNFDNQFSTLITGKSLFINTQTLLNQQATLTAQQNIAINSNEIDNQKALWIANKDLTVNTNQMNNNQSAMQAKQQMAIDADSILDNSNAILIAGSGGLSLKSNQIDNTLVDVSSKGDVIIDALKIANLKAKIVAEGAITINAETINNQQSNIQSNGNIKLDAKNIDNSDAQLLSVKSIQLSAIEEINNQRSQLTAQQNIDIQSKYRLDNKQAALTANKGISLLTGDIDNSGATISTNGFLLIDSTNLTNKKATLTANQLTLNTGSFQNQQANITATGLAKINADMITNTDAKLLANDVEIIAESLTGDGEILAQNNISLDLQSHFTNQSQLVANNQLSITATHVDNNGNLFSGGKLILASEHLNNNLLGEIDANNVLIKGGSFNNSGLVDGKNIELQLTGQLDNNDAARLYGDNIKITANEVNNTALSLAAGVSPTIAARENLDINVITLNNYNHALVLSMGSLSLDVVTVNNHSSKVESIGNMALNVGTLNNINDAIETDEVLTHTEHVIEYSLLSQAERYSPDKVTVSVSDKKNHRELVIRSLNGSFSGQTYQFYKYEYDKNTYQTQVINTAPAEIISGQNLTINAVHIENDNSKIIAGNRLDITAKTINNLSTQGIERNEIVGSVTKHDRKSKRTGVSGKLYLPTQSTTAYQDATNTSLDLANAKIEEYKNIDNTELAEYKRSEFGVTLTNDFADIDMSVTANSQLEGIIEDAFDVSYVDVGENLGQIAALPDAIISDIQVDQSNINAASSDASNVIIDQQNNSNITQGTVVDTASDTKLAGSVNLVEPNTSLPNNSLYIVNRDVEKNYLIETDPKFTNRTKWLSSDYMISQLKVDPNNVQKRLGDGYYEQQLIREQIVTLTGQRYLGDYSNDLSQYQALMNAGVEFAQQYGLSIGVALSPEQMMALTTDIVWMVTKTVTIDGQQHEVLVPQVYIVNNPQLTAEGALLAGKNIVLAVEDDINSSGTILAKNDTAILANNINNQGVIAGSTVSVQAKDTINSSGTIIGDKLVSLTANNDINLISTTSTTESFYGQNKSINTVIDNVSSIQVKDGDIKLNAGNDINLGAALLVNNSEAGETNIHAGNNINFSTVGTQTQQDIIWNKNNYRKMDVETVVGTEIIAAGDINLLGGNDINIIAGNLSADKTLNLSAANDINITSDIEHTELTDQLKSKSKGFLSKSSKTVHVEVDNTTQQGSSLMGEQVTMNAGNDLSITGSQVISTQDMTLNATGNVSIDASEESYYTYRQTIKEKSGLMSSGGLGFTVGQENSDLKQKDAEQAYVGSNVGSIEGKVTIEAGKDITLKGSDIIAKKDINLTGENILLESLDSQVTYNEEYTYEKSGITVAITGTAANIYDAVKAIDNAKKKDNDKLLALQSIKAALTAVQAAQDLELKNKEGQPEASIGISIMGGTQRTERELNQEQHNAVSSGVSAGDSITIIAKGNAEQGNGDIAIKGSEVRAGQDVTLDANHDISVIGAVNTQHSDRDEKNYGGGAGIQFQFGGDESGIRFKGNANFSQEREKSDGSAWSEGIVEAGKNLTVKTGNDTTIIGGQLSGDTVKIDVGNNLNIQSLQDTDNYDYEKLSASVGITAGWGGFSGNLALSQTEMESNWASVTDQSGIFAKEGGFDITVGNNTDLKGAVIASDAADKSKNKLDTGTIHFEDIKNKADFSVSHVSVSVGTSGTSPNAGLPTIYENSDKKSSTTKSAVEGGMLIVRDTENQQQDVNTLSRDTANANNPLDKIFDKQKEQDRMDSLDLVKDIAGQAKDITNKYDRIQAQNDLASGKDNIIKQAKDEYNGLTEEQKAAQSKNGINSAEDYANNAYYTAVSNKVTENASKNMGGMGSSINKGIDAASSIVSGIITGDITGGLAGASAPYLAGLIKEYTYERDEKGNKKVDKDGNYIVNTEANLIAHAILGGAVAAAQGNSALAGAGGAAGGEVIAKIIREELYGNKADKDLTESEKQNISNLTQLALGLGAAASGGSSSDVGAAMAGGKNAVENNALSKDDAWKKAGLQTKLPSLNDEDKAKALERISTLNELDKLDDKSFIDACSGGGNNTSDACGAQLAKLKAFKAEYEVSYGRYPYSEYLKEDYNKIVGYLNSYTPNEWTYAINNYAKENNISYDDAASKFELAMYTQKIADVAAIYYGVKGVGVVKGKVSAVDLAKAEAAINEYNAFKQELNKNNGALDKEYFKNQYGQDNVEQGFGDYKGTKDKILDNQITNQKANEASNFENHVVKEQDVNANLGKQPYDDIWTGTKNKTPVENAYGHWDKHKNEFPEFKNSKQYVDATHNFVNNPPAGTLVITRKNGEKIFYNPNSNIFAVKNTDGTPKTMFKPNPAEHGYKNNLEYFNAQK